MKHLQVTLGNQILVLCKIPDDAKAADQVLRAVADHVIHGVLVELVVRQSRSAGRTIEQLQITVDG